MALYISEQGKHSVALYISAQGEHSSRVRFVSVCHFVQR